MIYFVNFEEFGIFKNYYSALLDYIWGGGGGGACSLLIRIGIYFLKLSIASLLSVIKSSL